MDFMPDKEFHRLFLRVSRRVSFKGCRTPADVNRRLIQKAKEVMYVASDNPLERLRASYKADQYRRLVPAFGVRVVNEATSRPNGRISLTLRHGWEKAEVLFKRLEKLGLTRKWRRKRG